MTSTNGDIQLVAFYLPQFHRIPENDDWWGDGFTEWTNVLANRHKHKLRTSPRKPHSSIGFYDLNDVNVMAAQARLANQFGVGAFCFYFYWFNGVTLLEKPLENYLRASEIDFPFMLCWANENWTRTWDGLDHHILIEQSYSPEDDMAFITYVSKYLRDPRYIRLNGRPVLMVYRPEKMPSPVATTSRWRDWCAANGIGEIYLIGSWSFSKYDPREMGLDAALMTAPTGADVPEVRAPEYCDTNFEGKLYDWLAIAKRSEIYHTTTREFDLYFSTNPAWDNSPRKGTNANILCGNDPLAYKKWLINTIEAARLRAPREAKQLVFINAWNEWAEGAVLEPSEESGFAYLEATKLAIKETSFDGYASEYACSEHFKARIEETERLMVIHAFYEREFREILGQAADLEMSWSICITCPSALSQPIHDYLAKTKFEFMVLVVPNSGRDVLPFLYLGKVFNFFGADLVLKLHTKRSTHRQDGAAWLRSLAHTLCEAASSADYIARDGTAIGLAAPAEHIVPLSYYWGANSHRVARLIESYLPLHDQKQLIESSRYVAGTMFFATRALLDQLVQLPISPASFEEESGQIDGTLAHALERFFGILVTALELSILPITTQANESFNYAVPTDVNGKKLC